MWWRTPRRDEDFDDEIQAHLALETDRLIGQGMRPEDARLAARRAFGNVARTQERFYESRRVMWLDDLRRDLRYALRSLGRNPVFAAIAVITLTLGIGANTAIFSIVNAVVLRSLPYKDADRFVRISEQAPGAGESEIRPLGIIKPELDMLRASTWTLSHAGVYLPATFTLTGRDQAVRLSGMQVSPSIMAMLGIKPMLGRIFESREDSPLDRVVILGHGAWRRHLSADPDVIGQVLLFDGNPYSVIGVMPPGFHFPDSGSEFWVPFVFPLSARLVVTARLRDGVSRETASAEISALLQRYRASSPMSSAPPPPPPPPPPPGGGRRMTLDQVLALPPVSVVPGVARSSPRAPSEAPRVRLVGFHEFVVGSVGDALLLLSAAVGFVLLIACVNVANLLLARSAARRREFAVRLALGAGRARLVRQLLTESALLAIVGGLAGTGLAFAALRIVRALGEGLPRAGFGPSFGLPRVDEIVIDLPVLMFTAALSVIAGVGAGLLPALRISRTAQMDQELRAGSGAIVGGSHRIRRPGTGAVLVVAELAMATVLFIGGALLIRSFLELSNVEPGYDAAGLLTFQVVVPPGREARTFRDDLMGRLAVLPGVRGVAFADQLPMVGRRGTVFLRTTPGAPAGPPPAPSPGGNGPPQYPDLRIVSRDFLTVMGIRVVEGRGFGQQDSADRSNVMLINRALARTGYLGPNPIGKTVYAIGAAPWEVIGVVDDVRQAGLDQDPGPQVFVEFSQLIGRAAAASQTLPYFVVRTDGDPVDVVTVIRSVVKQLDSQATLDRVATMEQVVSNTLVRPRFYAMLLGVFAGVAAVLATVGIYGVMAYSVRQRSREIGIRMALGARRSAILALILRQGMTLASVGIVLGLFASVATTRYLAGMLFGVTALDLPTYASVTAVFGIVSCLASYVPARRATRLDPVVALRHD